MLTAIKPSGIKPRERLKKMWGLAPSLVFSAQITLQKENLQNNTLQYINTITYWKLWRNDHHNVSKHLILDQSPSIKICYYCLCSDSKTKKLFFMDKLNKTQVFVIITHQLWLSCVSHNKHTIFISSQFSVIARSSHPLTWRYNKSL